MLPIYYINSSDHPERRVQMATQFAELGLHPVRVEAIDLGSIPHRLSHRGWLRNAFFGIPPTALARLLSHADVLEYVAQSDAEWSLVLEDDLTLARALIAFLPALDTGLMAGVDLVRLEAGSAPVWLGPPLGPCGPVALNRLQGSTTGAGAYLVRPCAARALVDRMPQEGAGIDGLIFDRVGWGAANLRLAQVAPGLVHPLKEEDPTGTVLEMAGSARLGALRPQPPHRRRARLLRRVRRRLRLLDLQTLFSGSTVIRFAGEAALPWRP